MKIGVFDSGVGGLSVVNAIKKALSDLEVLYREDKENVPYGTKTPEQLLCLVTPILEEMVAEGCKIIVIACNTVTTNIIEDLRKLLPIPLLGMEPMVKPAAEISKTKVMAVCATPATLKSQRYAWLKATYASGFKVIEPDCSRWALMIETESVDRQEIERTVRDVLQHNADVIVLGCTHYHWIEKLINELAAGNATILQPEQPVIQQLQAVLKQLA